MILLVADALAGSCCAAIGAQPTALASCDRLGFVLGVGGDVAYGGWSLDRTWRAAGDDLDAQGNAALSGMGRLTPWLQAGARLPLSVALTELDGESTTQIGLGEAMAWVDVETPAGWPGTTTRLALELGLAGGGILHPDTVLGQLGLRASQDLGPWTLWGGAAGALPFIGEGPPTTNGSVLLDHALGAHRLGLGVGMSAELGTYASVASTIGPSLTLALSPKSHLLLGVRAGLPLSGTGQNAASRVLLTVDWYRVLLRT